MNNKFLNSLRLCALFLSCWGATACGEQVDESTTAIQIAKIHDGINLLTEQIEQADFYCKYQETTVVSGGEIPDRQSSTVFRYWQKGGKYWRIDSKVLQPDGSYIESRLIARPEGFAILAQAHSDQPLALVAYGGGEEAKDKASTNNSFPQAAVRYHNFSWTAELLNRLAENESIKLTELLQSRSGASTMSIESTDATTCTITLDAEARCIELKSTMLDSDGERRTRELKNEFDGFIVPSRQIETLVAQNGRCKEKEVKLLDYSEAPIPLGIFSLDSQGAGPRGNVWIRRLVMIVVGVALLGGFFAYRRMKNHG